MKKFLILFILLLLVPICLSAQTKATAAVDEWAEVAANGFREGAIIDISGDFDHTVHIYMVLSSETATTNGPSVQIQISSNTVGEGTDEHWTEWKTFNGPTGTANSEAVTGTEAAGSTVIECASTVGLYDDDDIRFIFFENTTVADSEIGTLVSHVANTSVTVMDGITNAQTSSTMFDIVKTWAIKLDLSGVRYRVIYVNNRDVSGPTIHTYARLTRLEAIQ